MVLGWENPLELSKKIDQDASPDYLALIAELLLAESAPRKLKGGLRTTPIANHSYSLDIDIFFKHITFNTATANAGNIQFGGDFPVDVNNSIAVDSLGTIEFFNINGKDIYYAGTSAGDVFSFVGEY